MRIYLAVGIITLFAPYSGATTIVIVRTPEQVVVGADRLLVNWQATRARRNSFSCKLHKQRSIFFTIAGMGVLHPATGFSAEQLARQAIEHSASMEQASAYFARIAVEPYAAVMRSMRKDSPLDWDLIQRYRGKAIPLIVVFFGIEKGISKYILVGLRASTGKSIVVVADTASCPGLACEGHTQEKHTIIIGESEAAYRQMDGAGKSPFVSFQGNRSDVELARSIIAVEERSVPAIVGGPIDVLTVDAVGERWNPPGGACLKPN